MGKKDFKGICQQAKKTNGTLSVKLSYFCDTYSSTASYAGIIIYAVDGQFKWTSTSGDTKGHGGQTFYVGIIDTAKYPAGELSRDVGQGRVHHYVIRKLIGREYSQDTVCCGGFAILKGKMHFSSVWLNQRDQYPKEGFGKSDGSKFLSTLEQEVVEYVIQQWAALGSNKVVSLPSSVESKIATEDVSALLSKMSLRTTPQQCTFKTSGYTYVEQTYARCLTCEIAGKLDGTKNEGVCAYCQETCHVGHTLLEQKTGRFYCDCGAKYCTKAYSSRAHPHYLYPNLRSGWICDGTKLRGGCRRGTTKESGANGYPRYRCDACDFDLCDYCLSYY
jgi:hypothetical protein